MNKQFRVLIEAASAVKLEGKEKSSIKASLISFIDSHPLPEDPGVGAAPSAAPSVTPKSTFESLQDTLQCFAPLPLLIGVLVLFILATGTAVASQHSNDGDLLFPLKEAINKHVESVKTLPHRVSVEIKNRRLHTNLYNVETLAAQGTLTAAAESEAAALVAKDSEKINQSVAAVQHQKNLPTAIRLASHTEGTLRAHERLISEAAKSIAQGDAGNLQERLAENVENLSQKRTELEVALVENGPDSRELKFAAEQAREHAEKSTATLRKALGRAKAAVRGEKIPESASAEISDVLKTAQHYFAQKDYLAAYIAFQKAERLAIENATIFEAVADNPAAFLSTLLRASYSSSSTEPLTAHIKANLAAVALP